MLHCGLNVLLANRKDTIINLYEKEWLLNNNSFVKHTNFVLKECNKLLVVNRESGILLIYFCDRCLLKSLR